MTNPFTAGQKLHASDLNFFIVGAASSADLVQTTTTVTDITSATVTFTTTHSNVIVTCTGIFDISCGGTGATAIGYLYVDGSQQNSQAIFDASAVSQRGTVAQCWTITLAAAGSHTFKLRGALSGNSGSYTFNHPHTTINALVLDL